MQDAHQDDKKGNRAKQDAYSRCVSGLLIRVNRLSLYGYLRHAFILPSTLCAASGIRRAADEDI